MSYTLRLIALTCTCLGIVAPSFPSSAEDAPVGGTGRPALCLIEVESVHYVGGPCLFVAIDKDGSFRVTTRTGIGAEIDVWGDELPRGFWSGPTGGTPNAVKLGELDFQNGCWSDEDSTLISAWNKDVHVFLGPTSDPRAPQNQEPDAAHSLQWGEREGMDADIIASHGLDTDHAVITAKKDFYGAVEWCRSNHDFSRYCIDDTLKPNKDIPQRTTLHGNCRTKVFTDFWGTRRKYLGNDRILDIEANEEIPQSPSANWGISMSAIQALCPKTLETPASP